jgi:hypothetical protein
MHKWASRVRRFLDGDDGRPHYTFNVEPKVPSWMAEAGFYE